MHNFVKCPCCSGHEAIGAETAAHLDLAIDVYLSGIADYGQAWYGELQNIQNVIRNTQEREPPLCPTPQKRCYETRKAALPHAAKWHQHPYECACGSWHLSKQTPAQHAAKINSSPASPDEFIDPLLL